MTLSILSLSTDSICTLVWVWSTLTASFPLTSCWLVIRLPSSFCACKAPIIGHTLQFRVTIMWHMHGGLALIGIPASCLWYFSCFHFISLPLLSTLLLLPVSDADKRGTLRHILILFLLSQASIYVVRDYICRELISLQFILFIRSKAVSPDQRRTMQFAWSKKKEKKVRWRHESSAFVECWSCVVGRGQEQLETYWHWNNNHAFSQYKAHMSCCINLRSHH